MRTFSSGLPGPTSVSHANHEMAALGFWPRLGVTLVDGMIVVGMIHLIMVLAGGTVGALCATFAGVLASWLGASPEQAAVWAVGLGGMAWVLAAVVTAITLYSLAMVLFITIEVATGMTPAKRLFGLQIRQRDGTPARRSQILLRGLVQDGGSVLWLAGFFFPPAAPVGLAWNWVSILGCLMALGSRRQALHDRVAGTAVFRLQ